MLSRSFLVIRYRMKARHWACAMPANVFFCRLRGAEFTCSGLKFVVFGLS